MSYVPPEFKKSAFNCPHCNAYANIYWGKLLHDIFTGGYRLTPLYASYCTHCEDYSYWLADPHPEGSDPVSGKMIRVWLF